MRAAGRDMLKAAVEEAANQAAKPQRAAAQAARRHRADLARPCRSRSDRRERRSLDQVLRLGALARDSGLDGVVCSPLEIAALRKQCGPDFVLMVPGIRAGRQRGQRPEAGDDAASGVDLGATTSWSAGRSTRRPIRAPRPRRSRAKPASTTYDRRGKICGLSTRGDGRRGGRGGARSWASSPIRSRRATISTETCARWRARARRRDAGRPVRRSRRCLLDEAVAPRALDLLAAARRARRPSASRPSSGAPASR
jgi:hypothetical protein